LHYTRVVMIITNTKFFSKTPMEEKHLLVVAKHTNDEGFIITAFFVRKVKEKEKVKVYEKG